MKTLQKVDSYFAKFLEGVCVFCLISLGTILCAKVFFRFVPLLSMFPSFSMGWFDEIIEFLFAWLVMTCATLLCRENEHFRVDIIQSYIKGRPLALLECIVFTVALVFYLLMVYYGTSLCITAVQTTANLRWTVRYFYLCIPFNAVFWCIYTIRNIAQNAVKLINPAQNNTGLEGTA